MASIIGITINAGAARTAAAFMLAAVIVASCNKGRVENPGASAEVKDTVKINEYNGSRIFGIPADSFNTLSGQIKPNRFLSEILGDYDISPQKIDQVIRNSSEVFNVKNIRARHNYTILTTRDSLASLRYFIYEHEPDLSYVFSFNDSLNITAFRKPVRSEIRFSSGVIETSLWESMKSRGINPELAIVLSEVYAWTIDFFGLSRSDSFKVIYEERFIDEKSLGIGKIYGARFVHNGVPVYAIPIIQNGTEGYFDADGKSLRKAFLKAPLRFSRISSRYSAGRMHPVLRIVRPHQGVDYAAPVGTPVYSIGDGTVTSTAYENQSGRIVRIRHNSVYSTAYLHLSGFAKGIRAGVYVRQGDVIGYVGSSGLSTGPHLDFRFYKNGYPVDPLKIESPPVEPVLEENLEKFEKIKSVTLRLIGSFN
jgi:murein DD-endopeptidase MepM/ murein hydrolase activator NlpD